MPVCRLRPDLGKDWTSRWPCSLRYQCGAVRDSRCQLAIVRRSLCSVSFRSQERCRGLLASNAVLLSSLSSASDIDCAVWRAAGSRHIIALAAGETMYVSLGVEAAHDANQGHLWRRVEGVSESGPLGLGQAPGASRPDASVNRTRFAPSRQKIHLILTLVPEHQGNICSHQCAPARQRPANVSPAGTSFQGGLSRKFHDHCSAHAVTSDSATADSWVNSRTVNSRFTMAAANCARDGRGRVQVVQRSCMIARRGEKLPTAHTTDTVPHATTSPAMLQLPRDSRHDCHIAGLDNDPLLHELDNDNIYPAPPVFASESPHFSRHEPP